MHLVMTNPSARDGQLVPPCGSTIMLISVAVLTALSSIREFEIIPSPVAGKPQAPGTPSVKLASARDATWKTVATEAIATSCHSFL